MSASVHLRQEGYCKCEGSNTLWMSPRSESIVTYALAGFANLQCIGRVFTKITFWKGIFVGPQKALACKFLYKGIMIGGLSCMVPSRKELVAKLGKLSTTKSCYNVYYSRPRTYWRINCLSYTRLHGGNTL